MASYSGLCFVLSSVFLIIVSNLYIVCTLSVVLSDMANEDVHISY